MSLLSTNSIFQPTNKAIRFSGSDIVVTSGANFVAKLDLCSVNMKYLQYQKLSLQVPAGATDFLLDFSIMGLKITFLSIKPKFCGNCNSCNYIKWKFQMSTDPKLSMTSLMVLTGTTSNPIPNIIIDNPSADCPIQIDLLVGAMENDGLNDVNAFIYLNNLEYDDVHTLGETNSGILAFYTSTGDLAGTVNISDIINITKVPNLNRIIIDESSSENIILDYISSGEALQALSALNWLLLDPSNRSLPQAKDLTPPVVTLSNRIISGTISIDLSLFSDNYTKLNVINDAIDSIVDDRDGQIIATVNNIYISQGTLDFTTITMPGLYTVSVVIKDIAGNETTETFTIDAQAVIADNTLPIIVHTGNVTGNIVNSIDLANYPLTQFTYDNAKVLTIQSVTDNLDGVLSLNDVSVSFFDVNGVPVSSPITQEGNYTIRLAVQDSHANLFTEDLVIAIDNTLVDSAPEVDYTTNVNAISLTSSISLSVNYGSGAGTFTKNDALSFLIQTVIDDIDGPIIPTSANVDFYNNLLVNIPSINAIGTYTVVFTIADGALNITVKTITLTVTA